jgi:hypothetical protein
LAHEERGFAYIREKLAKISNALFECGELAPDEYMLPAGSKLLRPLTFPGLHPWQIWKQFVIGVEYPLVRAVGNCGRFP